jgi:hypothetical protein
MILRTVTAGCVALALFWVGCSGGHSGEATVPVKGKVTDGGKPLALDPKLAAAKAASVQVRFLPADESGKGTSATAFADPDGTFEVTGGLPKGKYRIAVMYYDGSAGGGDKLGGKFDERNSPIVREITGEGDVVIDLSKPEG